MPLRMWKFLRKHYAGISDPLERELLAAKEFDLDLFVYGPGSKKPCFSPILEPWCDDVEIESSETVHGDRKIWERTIHTPAGELHDVKQAKIVKQGSGGGPEIIEPLVKDVSRDLDAYRYMHEDAKRIDIGRGLERTRRIGDSGIVVGDMYSPIDCRDAMKPIDFMMLYYDDRGAFDEIVSIGAEAMMAETKVVLEAGFRIIKTWWFYCSPSYGWSPEIYENVFLPHLVRHVELVHEYNATYIYYDDGKLKQFLDFYIDAGIDCLMTCAPPPLGDVDPVELKGNYGDRIHIMGCFDAVNEVYLSDPASIRRVVSERRPILKEGGGYIMDGSNSIVYETPVEHVLAFAEAGREYGEYC